MIDFSLSAEEELIVQTARQFADEQLRPHEREHERQGVSAEVAQRYRDLGFATIDVPEALGGQGLGRFVKCLAMEELARGDAGALLAVDGPGPALYFLLELPDEERARLLAPLLDAPGRRGVLFTDWERTLAAGDGRVSGTVPVVPAARVDVLVVVQGAAAYVLREGVAVRAVHGSGLGAAGGSALALQAAPAVATCDDAAALTRAFAGVRAYAAAVLVGIARAALDYALRYTQERVVFGKPIAHHQAPAFLLADMSTGIAAARLAVWRAATLIDQKDGGALAAAAAAFGEAADQALAVTQQAVQLLGGHGFITDHPVEKWMRDARTLALLWGGRDGALSEAATGIWPPAAAAAQP